MYDLRFWNYDFNTLITTIQKIAKILLPEEC